MNVDVPTATRYRRDVVNDGGHIDAPFCICYHVRQLMHDIPLFGATSSVYLGWMGTAWLQASQPEIDHQLFSAQRELDGTIDRLVSLYDGAAHIHCYRLC